MELKISDVLGLGGLVHPTIAPHKTHSICWIQKKSVEHFQFNAPEMQLPTI